MKNFNLVRNLSLPQCLPQLLSCDCLKPLLNLPLPRCLTNHMHPELKNLQFLHPPKRYCNQNVEYFTECFWMTAASCGMNNLSRTIFLRVFVLLSSKSHSLLQIEDFLVKPPWMYSVSAAACLPSLSSNSSSTVQPFKLPLYFSNQMRHWMVTLC